MAARDLFFERMDQEFLALTFRDVRLETARSTVKPGQVSTASRFSRNISLHIPVVSAAMDTVTEYEMAIGMAMLGGLGIIHRNLSPAEQAAHVERVKFFINGRVDKPICVREDETLESILKRKEEKGYAFNSFPVLGVSGKLVGLLTSNDFFFCDNLGSTAGEAMTRELITASPDTSVDAACDLMRREKKKVLPLVDENGTLTGLYIYSDLQRIRSGGPHTVDTKGQLRVGAAVGVGEAELTRAELLIKAGVDALVVDSAHGGHQDIITMVRELKRRYPSGPDIVGGNVSTAACAKDLVEAGADCVKVGQGPGAICTTRIVAGIGCPQATAIHRCEKAIRGSGVPVCGDGGLEYSGDITVALAAGAHSVMMGSMLAGTKEAPGRTVFYQGRSWKTYRGMGSLSAMLESRGARQRYQQADASRTEVVPEGIEGIVPFRGELATVMHQYMGGLRSGMGYLGTPTTDDLRELAQFIRITSAGESESHPRVQMTEEAPNYTPRGDR